MNDQINQYFAFWKELGLNQKVSIIVSGLVVVIASIALFAWTQRPDMSLLFGSVSTKDASAIVEYLEQEGVDYEIRAGGSAIYVPRDQVYKLRMNVTAQGLVQGDGAGFEIFDRSSFGISDFIQRTNYIRAIQGELGRTITQLNGVRSARVMVVIPENRLLVVNDSVETTASVFVEIGAGMLAPGAVRSIQALVANSVLGLTVSNVAVVDNNGNVLSKDQGEDNIMQAGSSVIEYRQNLEKYFSKKVESMLEAVVGPGNAIVRVAAEIDASQISTVEELFNNEGGVLREESKTERINSTVTNENMEGNAAVDEAVAPNAGAMANASRTDDETVESEKRYEIDRTVRNRVEAPGRIQRVSASVFVAMKMVPDGAEGEELIPQPRTDEEMRKLQQMVANALGVVPDEANLGAITLQETVFSREMLAPMQAGTLQSFDYSALMQYADQIIGGLISVIIFIVFLRMLKRARSERGPLDRVQEMRMEERAESELFGNQTLTPELLNRLIRQKPENVSMSLRNWLSGEGKQ